MTFETFILILCFVVILLFFASVIFIINNPDKINIILAVWIISGVSILLFRFIFPSTYYLKDCKFIEGTVTEKILINEFPVGTLTTVILTEENEEIRIDSRDLYDSCKEGDRVQAEIFPNKKDGQILKPYLRKFTVFSRTLEN